MRDLPRDKIPFSVLDLSPITEGSDARTALMNTLALARHVEQLGYERFWLAEHHSMPGIASAATSVVIAHVAAGTSSIRVGAGGVMLPNHAPLVIAEQYGTLAALHPGRIDLGLGRAPGSDALTLRALRRSYASADSFPKDVKELLAWFEPAEPGQPVRAVPGEGLEVPIWILGSSLFGAQLAASLGLPYAFASHFAPLHMMDAVRIYRGLFKPSARLTRPYVMLAANAIVADTDDEARLLFTSLEQAFMQLRRGVPGKLLPPDPNLARHMTPQDRAMLEHTFSCSFVGSISTVREALRAFIARAEPDELMFTTQVFDHGARLRSFTLLREVHDALERDRVLRRPTATL